MSTTLPEFLDLFNELDVKLNELEIESADSLANAKNAIRLCSDYIDLLKRKVKEHGFKDEETEIRFFKHTKPRFVGLYIYYIELLKFHQGIA